jgi:DNA primase
VIDTSNINQQVSLLAWVERDTELKQKTKGGRHNGEFCGPCPWCGGTDRFLVWPNDDPPGWWCRQCQRGGDIISYVMQRHNVVFVEACKWLSNGRVPTTPGGRTGRREKTRHAPVPSPPPADWQEKAKRIAAEFETALWSDAGARARSYLGNQRGLTDDTLRAWHVGYCHKEGHYHGLYVPRGIVLPWFAGGRLWKVQIRRPTNDPKKRYVQVQGSAGSCPGLFGADKLTGKSGCFVVEGELDCMLMWQEAGDLVDVLTIGSKDGKLATRWLPLLLPIRRFWIATDNDPGGHQAAAYWLDSTGDRGRRILPPNRAKDMGDAWLAGADIHAWAKSALTGESAIPSMSEPTDDHESEGAALLDQMDSMDNLESCQRRAELAARAERP